MQKNIQPFWLLTGLFIVIYFLVIFLHFSSDIKPKEFFIQEDKTPIDTLIEGRDSFVANSCQVTSHKMSWKSYGGISGKEFRAIFKICKEDFINARTNRKIVGLKKVEGRNLRSIDYNHLITHDKPFLKKTVQLFKNIAKKHQLNYKETADMVVSCIQQIDYVLVHNKTCEYYLKQCQSGRLENNSFDCKWHLGLSPYRPENGNQRNPCIEEIEPYGVQSPAEFLFNLKGDCDTRTSFLFLILKNMGYDIVILNSDIHSHSILGININAGPFATNFYYNHSNNIKYYVWESTSTGFPVGVYPKAFKSSEWYIALI